MKRLIVFLLILWGTKSWAQKATLPLPLDSRGYPLTFGLGPSYASSLSVSVTDYDTSQRIQAPSTGNDTDRAYRHLYVLNRSSTRSVSIAMGDVNGAGATDTMVVRPGYGLVFEPILFGKPFNTDYIYFKLDSAGSANVDVTIW